MIITCAECSKPVEKTGSSQRYCKPCARAVHLRIKRECETRKNRAKGSAAIGSEVPCQRCGGGILKTGGNKRFCSPCAKAKVAEDKKEAARREKDRSPERVKARSRRHYEGNREEIRKKAQERNATEDTRRYYRERVRRLRSEDPRFALAARVRLAIWRGLKSRKQGRHWEDLVGYSLGELAAHIERQFLDGMSWDNMGEWHVDHIRPVASFQFSAPEDPDFKACWALTNLRPLWALENQAKGAKPLYLL